MPLPFRPNCLPAALGPLPFAQSRAAWEACRQYLPALPPLPLLVGHGEDAETVAMTGFGGVARVQEQWRLDRAASAAAIDELYLAYLRNRWETRALNLRALDEWGQREAQVRRADALSTVVMGPVSTALRLVDAEGLPALGDTVIMDALCKHLHLRLQWQHKLLGRNAKVVIQWLYEPYLEVVNSPFAPLDWTAVHHHLDETFGTTPGVRAVWTDAGTDLPALLDGTTVEVVGLAPPPVDVLQRWAPALQTFVRRKGVIGWGIVPQTSDALAHAKVGRVAARFTAMLETLAAVGVATSEVVAASIIMPEDTLEHLQPNEAEAALALTHQVTGLLRHSYGLD